jgi:hypothetical protein
LVSLLGSTIFVMPGSNPGYAITDGGMPGRVSDACHKMEWLESGHPRRVQDG